LYGGTGELSECSKRQLTEFLQANPEKAEAWAGVQGITVDEIPAFIESLLVAKLTKNTRVTNHGFKDGKAYPIQSVLEPGTAVLVDADGGLRVRCKCGNPLKPPVQVDDPTYVGEPWPEFDEDDLVAPPDTPAPDPKDVVGIYTVRNLAVVATKNEIETKEACELFPDSPRDGCDFTLPEQGEVRLLAGPYPTAGDANAAMCAAIVPGSVGLYDQLPGLYVVALDFDGGDYAINRIDGCAAFDDAPPPTSTPPPSTTPTPSPSPSPTPELTNVALGAASESPDTDPNFPEPFGVDGLNDTSWFSLGPGADGKTTYTIHLPQPSTISKVEFVGNRRNATVEFREDFGFASWTIELLGADGQTLLIIESSNDPEANQTAEFTAVPGVTEVLWTGQGSESPTCGGFGDIKLFGFATPG
jgi:hypothetical protein